MLWKSDLPYIGHFELKNPDGWANCYKVEKDRGAQPVQLQTLPDYHHYDDHDHFNMVIMIIMIMMITMRNAMMIMIDRCL